jgi:hypothetical protein
MCVCSACTHAYLDDDTRGFSSVRENFAAGEMMQQGWALLNIRPPTETQKVDIVGAVTCCVI